MKLYRGIRLKNQTYVQVDRKKLPWRLDLWNHSPSGLEWGYNGSGPAQLALALLADHLSDDRRALALYQRFKLDVISGLPLGENWTLTSDDIDAWLLRATEKRSRA